MPDLPFRICTHPGCGKLVKARTRQGARCEAHARKPWTAAKASPERVRGRALQARRQWFFSKHPICVECERRGRSPAVATILDHVIPLAEGGPDEYENWQGLCHDCHDEKTREETKRGSSRFRMGQDRG